MRKKLIIRLLLLFFLTAIMTAYPLFSHESGQVAEIIKAAFEYSESIKKNTQLTPFIPFVDYIDGVDYIANAKKEYNNKKFSEALYWAVAGLNKFKTASVKAETSKIINEIPVKNNTSYTIYSAIIKSNLKKKGNFYTASLADKDIFSNNNFELSKQGVEILSEMLEVLSIDSSAMLKIVGHTEYFDKNYSVSSRKAKAIENYFISNEIPQENIQSIGAGNSEAARTDIGYRRFNRIELIVSGLPDLSEEDNQ